MRKRIVSKILPRQDICLCCTFRLAYRSLAIHHAGSKLTDKAYSTTASRPSQAEAAAPQSRDEVQDDESPMLRQNASLTSSFPFQKRKPQNPPSQDLSSSQSKIPPRFSPRSNGQRDRMERPSPNRESQFRITYQRSGKNVDAGQSTQQAHDPSRTRSGGTNSSKPSATMRRLQLNNSPEVELQPSRPSSHRVFTNRNFGEDRDNGTEKSQGYANRSTRWQGNEKRESREGYSYGSAFGTQSAGQKADRFPDNAARIPHNGRGHSSRKTDQGSGAEELSRSVGLDKGITETIEAPAGMSFNAENDEFDFHQRRRQHHDRRKSRAERLEQEEDEAATADTSNKSSSRPMEPTTNRGGVRGNRFDYEMAEAEQALYGDSKTRRNRKGVKSKVTHQAEATRPSIRLSEFMSVGQLSNALGVQLDHFIRKLEEEGFEGARYDHILDSQNSAMVADLYGFDPLIAESEPSLDLMARPSPEDMSDLPSRPPIVTIMGHVDHGKTTILDYLRKSSVVATEHGGITQHIGAFSVMMPGSNRQITFLDTPGHAAFLEMRRRGANVTDIVVLVVAADDSVKPQTIEAIKHAIDAKVQIIVAINKVDKEDANIERVKQDLTRHEIVVEDYGGDYQAIPVSGKTGQGMSELEEAILTLADVYDFRAEVDGPAEGTIIESTVTAGGRVATVLVRRGTLRPGDFIVAGATWARVRTLRNDVGVLVKEAPPGTPVQVDGWRGEDPTAGLEVLQAETEDQAKSVVDYRIEQRELMRASADMEVINESRSEEAEARAKVRAWEAEQEWARKSHGLRPKDNAGWVEPTAEGGPKQVHFVVKADVAGSVEAVVAAVTSVGNSEIVSKVVHSGIGPLTESDIKMLAATDGRGYAISFNQPVDGAMARLAEAADLQILDYNIIYKVTDVVKEKLAEQLPPIVTQKVLGEAEIGQIFEITLKNKTKQKIAGCKVTNGTINRANKVRVQRAGQVIYTGTLDSLKNVKKDVTEMRKGTECGMGFQDWSDFREGDQIQCFEELEEKRTLY